MKTSDWTFGWGVLALIAGILLLLVVCFCWLLVTFVLMLILLGLTYPFAPAQSYGPEYETYMNVIGSIAGIAGLGICAWCCWKMYWGNEMGGSGSVAPTDCARHQ